MFQEDISKLRRKIEKAKKPAEKISNGDDILNEEINDYKVCSCDSKYAENFFTDPAHPRAFNGYFFSVSSHKVTSRDSRNYSSQPGNKPAKHVFLFLH